MGNKSGKQLSYSYTSCFKGVETNAANVLKEEEEEEGENYSTAPETLRSYTLSSWNDGHSHSHPTYVCEFCLEAKPLDDSFNPKGCAHFYCLDCTVKYVGSKVEDNVMVIGCPAANCGGMLDPDWCFDVLPLGLFFKWGKALAESSIVDSQKLYCPYNDCAALLINDIIITNTKNNDDDDDATMRFNCPVCKREFCLRCKVAWHSGVNCKKFQKLKKRDGDGDAMLVDLAVRSKWMKCPSCTRFVQKASGCNHITCRCRTAFCYNCGARKIKGGSHTCSCRS